MSDDRNPLRYHAIAATTPRAGGGPGVDKPPCMAARHGCLLLRIVAAHYGKLQAHLQVRPGTPWRLRRAIGEHLRVLETHLADAYAVAALIAEKAKPIGADEDRHGWEWAAADALIRALDADATEDAP